MWGVILWLGALLLFFIYRYKRNHIVTAEAMRNLEETRQEFETHRKKALEREQKLNRRLPDELNTQLGYQHGSPQNCCRKLTYYLRSVYTGQGIFVENVKKH